MSVKRPLFIIKTCDVSCQHTFGRLSVANLALFPRIWACFFCGVAFFLKTCRLLVLIQICLFSADFCFADCFFSNFMALCCFNLLPKAYWACFCKNLLILGLFFRIYHPDLLFAFLGDFSFCYFRANAFGLVFRFNYLFLACFSNLLACF